jgi:hypothetical protein
MDGTGQTFKEKGIWLYYSTGWPREKHLLANIERHGYLLTPINRLPETWEYTGTGHGGDTGTVFKYRWLNPAELHLVDPGSGMSDPTINQRFV